MSELVDRIAQELHDMTVRKGGVSRGAADMVADARSLLAVMRPLTDEQTDPVDAYIEREVLYMETSVADIWEHVIDGALAT